MSRVAPQAREPVNLVVRRFMSKTEKLNRWIELGRSCSWCGEICDWEGKNVIWDHRIAIALGGSNDLSNMEPHHAKGCAPEKTRFDARDIAKARRLRKKNLDPATRALEKPKRPIHNKGFDPSRTRGLNGKVRMK